MSKYVQLLFPSNEIYTMPSQSNKYNRPLTVSMEFSPPCVHLAALPTPLQELRNLRNHLGGPSRCPKILVKRDDMTGIATGGNKVRKLEYLLGEAVHSGADTIITTGFAQSNHCRQTAACSASLGLRCILALSGDAPPEGNTTGNLLLSSLCGAEIRWIGTTPRDEATAQFAAEVKSQGGKPYVIPTGGSTATGALGYVNAVKELTEQLAASNQTVDVVVFTSGSGGTHAGIWLGAKRFSWNAKLEAVSQDASLKGKVCTITKQAASLLHDTPPPTSEFTEFPLFNRHRFGEITNSEREALKVIAKTEGIICDPLYSGCSAARLLELIRTGVVKPHQTVLWWHTGGQTGLFPLASKL